MKPSDDLAHLQRDRPVKLRIARLEHLGLGADPELRQHLVALPDQLLHEAAYPGRVGRFPELAFQASLFDGDAVAFDATFAGVERRDLAEGAWVEHGAGWLRGADRLFEQVLAATSWRHKDRWMYDRMVPEPRLTARWEVDDPDLPVPELRAVAHALSERYAVAFTQVGANLYRDGSDSVAWHGDRVARDLPEAVVALISLGAVRPFKLRPRGGGPSVGYRPGHGDLLVMGGSCQRTWDHAVPKVRSAGPRISIQFRHAYDVR